MRKFLAEFRDFINKGDIVTIAVGLIIALYFAQIVNALLQGVVYPIIAAIFGQPDMSSIGFDIGDARISIGLVFNAIISFVVVAFILFLMIKAYNHFRNQQDAGPTEAELLTEIRDELRAQRQLPPPPPR
jgi:large conductance mechanosensitive channel